MPILCSRLVLLYTCLIRLPMLPKLRILTIPTSKSFQNAGVIRNDLKDPVHLGHLSHVKQHVLGLATRLFQARTNTYFSVVAFGRNSVGMCYIRTTMTDLTGSRRTVAVEMEASEVEYTEPVSDILDVSAEKDNYIRIGY
ncbi:hypothetical protein LTR36_007443 [Oleoguttula mirabilis]|uniref:Uncharacterized protein n=1 Tax=Oleoguttula mirabilis TaxID=1507867 RepID=A0AAV9J9F3_9PEZI|nr:hypothetical protein LTR36_007443 [Oleoguttula mirabilis]